MEFKKKQELAGGGNVVGAFGTFEYGLLSDEPTDGAAVFDCVSGVHISVGGASFGKNRSGIKERGARL